MLANPDSGIAALKPVCLALLLGVAMTGAAAAQQTAANNATITAHGESQLDVPQLFATTCGWCHNGAGRVAGRGPQLMDTKRSDDFIRTRIKLGKEGAMPSFAGSFNDADIDRIIAYIRNLKPEPQ